MYSIWQLWHLLTTIYFTCHPSPFFLLVVLPSDAIPSLGVLTSVYGIMTTGIMIKRTNHHVMYAFVFILFLIMPASPLMMNSFVHKKRSVASEPGVLRLRMTSVDGRIPPDPERVSRRRRRLILSFLASGSIGVYTSHIQSASAQDTKPVIAPPTIHQRQSTASDTHQEVSNDCDESCKAERMRRIEERRAMMRQSRSSTSRQEVFDLSRQRAKLYGTEYQGAKCPEGIPCF